MERSAAERRGDIEEAEGNGDEERQGAIDDVEWVELEEPQAKCRGGFAGVAFEAAFLSRCHAMMLPR